MERTILTQRKTRLNYKKKTGMQSMWKEKKIHTTPLQVLAMKSNFLLFKNSGAVLGTSLNIGKCHTFLTITKWKII